MLLKNYWETKRVTEQSGYFTLTSSVSASNPSGLMTAMKTLAGDDFGYLWSFKTSENIAGYSNLSPYASAQLGPFNAAITNYYVSETMGFRVGTGSTPVSIDDYKLDTDVTSSFSDRRCTTEFSSEDGHMIITETWVGTNNTAEDITITEVGILNRFLSVVNPANGVTANGNSSAKAVLLLRKVLETPILVPAGHTATITIRIDES